jgi:hypothetical protein
MSIKYEIKEYPDGLKYIFNVDEQILIPIDETNPHYLEYLISIQENPKKKKGDV